MIDLERAFDEFAADDARQARRGAAAAASAGASNKVREPVRSRKATSSRDSASRSSRRTMWPCSVTSLRRNLRRAGRL